MDDNRRRAGAEFLKVGGIMFLVMAGLWVGSQALLGVGAGPQQGYRDNAKARAESWFPAQTYSAQTYSASTFANIQNGMKQRDLFDLVGPGELLSESSVGDIHTVMYQWKNSDGSNFNVMLQNDRVVMKAQYGLK